MEHTAGTLGSSEQAYRDILVGSSKAAWSLSGGGGPAESFDPFMMSAHAVLSTVILPFSLLSNFVNDTLSGKHVIVRA